MQLTIKENRYEDSYRVVDADTQELVAEFSLNHERLAKVFCSIHAMFKVIQDLLAQGTEREIETGIGMLSEMTPAYYAANALISKIEKELNDDQNR